MSRATGWNPLALTHTYDLIRVLKVGRIRPDPRGQLPCCELSVVGVEVTVGSVSSVSSPSCCCCCCAVYVFVGDCSCLAHDTLFTGPPIGRRVSTWRSATICQLAKEIQLGEPRAEKRAITYANNLLHNNRDSRHCANRASPARAHRKSLPSAIRS